MRKLIVSAMFLAGVHAGAYAQGTVAFQNYTTGTVTGVINGFGTNLFSGPIHLELFWGPLGDTAEQLLVLDTGLVFSTTIPPVAAGHFSDGTVAVTSGPLGLGSGDVNSVELMIAAWVGGTGTDYVNAAANGAIGGGTTAPFANPTGGAGTPAASPANLVGWTLANPVIFPVPEPATIGLGILGGAMLLLFRQRK